MGCVGAGAAEGPVGSGAAVGTVGAAGADGSADISAPPLPWGTGPITWVGALGGSAWGALATGLLTASTSTAISRSWARRLGGGGALFDSWAGRILGGGGALRLLGGGGALRELGAERRLGGGGVLRETGPVRMDGGGAGAPASPGRGGRGGRFETGPLSFPLGGEGGDALGFDGVPSSICAASALDTRLEPGLDSRGLRFANSSSLDAASRSLIVRSVQARAEG